MYGIKEINVDELINDLGSSNNRAKYNSKKEKK